MASIFNQNIIITMVHPSTSMCNKLCVSGSWQKRSCVLQFNYHTGNQGGSLLYHCLNNELNKVNPAHTLIYI